MKKIYSIVLMAAMLLVGTSAKAVTVSSDADLRNAIQTAVDNCSTVEIVLGDNIALTAPLQIYAPATLFPDRTSPYFAGDAAYAATAPNITLNLGSYNLTSAKSKHAIELYKGHLTIVGNGGQIQGHAEGSASELILVSGSRDPQASDWSTLTLGAGARIAQTYAGKSAISVDGFFAKTYWNYSTESGLDGDYCYDPDYESKKGYNKASKGGTVLISYDVIGYWSYEPKYLATVTSGKGYKQSGNEAYAFGAKVVMLDGSYVYGAKYGIKVNGTIRQKEGNVPEVIIYNGSELVCSPDASNATAVYSSGYGKWTIKGEVHGSTGVYVKAGEVSVEDGANIYSEGTNDGIAATGKTSGISAGGVAIAIEGDNSAYSSEGISVEISGGTIQAGTDGYAVQNANADGTATPKAVTITGGEFLGSDGESTGGVAGCVTIDEGVDVVLEGGTFTGDIQTLIAATTDSENIISQVVAEDGEGNATVVIGKKDSNDEMVAPASEEAKEEFVFANNMSNDIVKLEANAQDLAYTLPAGTTTVKYLSLTGVGHTTTVTVEEGKTLSVGQIVMNENGRIVVEAGAKLIVTGANGIFAENVENIVLEATQGNQSTFIMDPEVSTNKHPKATVQFISKSYYVNAETYLNQRFGIPTIGALESITADYPTRIWGYFNAHWDLIGTVIPGQDFDASVMDKPFAYYQMSNNNPVAGTVVTMTGSLVGIENPEIELIANNWSTFSNSFMANINATKMMDMFEGHPNIDATIQTFKPTNTTNFAWMPFNRANILIGENTDVEPMQAFIVKNNGEADNLVINYETMVWEPFEASLAPAAPGAPRKRAAVDMTTARIQVSNAEGNYDYVTLLVDNQFSAEYDNGYDAEHVMNNTLDLYTVGVKNLATMATDNLDNTVIGMTCAEAGDYTISFSHINGDNLTLIDRATGARIAMVEGNTYDFTVEAGEANRFEIVASAKLPTDIENTDAKNAKGAVYTITGQYVGSVENWNVLPAGVYVIDGVKCVK